MLKTDLAIIHKHIFGDVLSEAEILLFDQQLAQDQEFKACYEELMTTRRLVRRIARHEIRQKLVHFKQTGDFPQETEDETDQQPSFSILRGGKWKMIAAAASVVLTTGLAVYLLQKRPEISFDIVAEKTQYRTFNYLKLSTIRGKQKPTVETPKLPIDSDIAYLTTQYGAENAQKISVAMTELNAKNYDKAVSILENLSFINANDSMRLSRADAYLGANNYDKAIADYQIIAQNTTPQYRDLRMIAEWHLALTYLKKGDLTESRRRIQLIAEMADHNFQKEAKETLKMW